VTYSSKGLFVNYVHVYGLAVDYKRLTGIQMKATIDFEKARTYFYAQRDPVTI